MDCEYPLIIRQQLGTNKRGDVINKCHSQHRQTAARRTVDSFMPRVSFFVKCFLLSGGPLIMTVFSEASSRKHPFL